MIKNCDNCKYTKYKSNQYPCIECVNGDINDYWKVVKSDCENCLLTDVAQEDIICKECNGVMI